MCVTISYSACWKFYLISYGHALVYSGHIFSVWLMPQFNSFLLFFIFKLSCVSKKDIVHTILYIYIVYYHHLVDTSAGGLLVPEGINNSVVSVYLAHGVHVLDIFMFAIDSS